MIQKIIKTIKIIMKYLYTQTHIFLAENLVKLKF